jgi:hypothetical protein
MSPTALELFGTTEPAAERRVVRAGPLSVVLENGGLRDIRFHGVEALRAVSYLARDAFWGTFRAALSGLLVEENGDSFTIDYSAHCGAGFAYRMRITGDASGHLVLDAEGEALEDFHTNRTGFVVLHAAEAAGGKLTIVHSDGNREETHFPARISPDQPAFDIAAMIHEPAPGMLCTVKMSGDAFEMEDQRNWADASFKTYIRPLAKPRPYVIGKGERDIQQIAVHVTGTPPAAEMAATGSARIILGERRGPMPAIALFLDAAHLPNEQQRAAIPRPAGQRLIARFDPEAGHDAAYLTGISNIARQLGADLAIEIIFDARDPDREAVAAMQAIRAAGARPVALLVSPRREFKTRPSGSLPQGEHGTDDLVAALRRAGASGPIGTGTPSNFTEFNRNPPGRGCDFVFFGISAIVHAADDISVMETLTAYPAVIDSARGLTPARPIWLGPCAIATRQNPYGADVVANPEAGRVAAARDDPRQGALFGAAYAVGVAARAAVANIETLILASPAGPFGLVGDDAKARPIATVHALLASAAGMARVETSCANSGLATIAFDTADGLQMLAANLTSEPIRLEIPWPLRSAEILESGGAMAPLEIGDGAIDIPAYRVVCMAGR